MSYNHFPIISLWQMFVAMQVMQTVNWLKNQDLGGGIPNEH